MLSTIYSKKGKRKKIKGTITSGLSKEVFKKNFLIIYSRLRFLERPVNLDTDSYFHFTNADNHFNSHFVVANSVLVNGRFSLAIGDPSLFHKERFSE